MRLLDRYIIWRVLRATVLGGAVLSVLMALFLYVNEQGWVGVGRYGNLQAALHVLFTLPVTLLPFLPVAALFGALMAMGQLARGSELTVMRAAGVPVWRIGGAVFVAGLLLLPIALVIGEWVAPPLARMALETRAKERDGAISLTPQGVWLRDGERILRADAGAEGGFTLFEFRADDSLAAVARASGAHALPDGGWELEDLRGTRLDGDRVIPWSAAEQRLRLAAGPDFFSVASTRPDQMSLTDLARTIDYLRANGQDARRHRFAFWAGIARLAALPLAMLLAVPLVMGRLRGAENAARATLGLVLGLAWYIAQRMVESGALAFALSPPLMALLPTLLLAAGVVWLLARLPRINAA
jgi:lipopolysaccharide export system permease protein